MTRDFAALPAATAEAERPSALKHAAGGCARESVGVFEADLRRVGRRAGPFPFATELEFTRERADENADTSTASTPAGTRASKRASSQGVSPNRSTRVCPTP